MITASNVPRIHIYKSDTKKIQYLHYSWHVHVKFHCCVVSWYAVLGV